MAKKLLLDVLVKVLGEFIELNEDNLDLSLAVWSGHIALKDLKLKTHKLLRNFDLSILHGEIKTLEVTIPWTALLNSPVKVLIDGVNLQVGPLNVAALDKEETKKRVISAKMSKLRMVDRFIDYSSSGTTGSAIEDDAMGDGADKDRKQSIPPNARATYIQQWTSKIIDNIEITLKNVHIRYEDSQTIPGSPFSAGITLNSFTLSTCDEKWHEKFVARDINKPTSSIRKMAKVYNFGLYWMTKSQVLSGESFKDWSAKMRALIYPGLGTSEKSFFGDIQYILHPANNLIVRLIHNARSEIDVPKFDMIVESTNLPLSIDRVQYLQLLRTMEMIGVTERRRQPYMFRPYERPSNPERARAWWKYACKMIVKKVRYIHLLKRSKAINEDTGVIDVRTADEKREARELEERMPLRSLVIFRHAAAREMHLDARKRYLQQEREAREKGLNYPTHRAGATPRTWMGWAAGLEGDAVSHTSTASGGTDDSYNELIGSAEKLSGGGDKGGEKDREKEKEKDRETELEGDVSIASIISSLEREEDTVDLSRSAALFRLSLTTSASLDVGVGGAPVASATMALSVLAEVTTWGVSATVQMRDLLVIDRCTVTPAISNIIAVKQLSGSGSQVEMSHASLEDALRESERKKDTSPSFSVVYENLNSRTVIRVSALPAEIAVNKLCVQQLIGLFLAPASSSSRKQPQRPDANKIKKIFQNQDPGSSVKSGSSSSSPRKPDRTEGLDRKASKFYIEGLEGLGLEGADIDFKFRIESEAERSGDDEKADEGGKKRKVKGGKEKRWKGDGEKGQGDSAGEDNVGEEGEEGEEEGEKDDRFLHGGREGDLEIIFEAHAPKIIIPQESSADRGYLLLDTGYLAVRGFLGPTSMSWDVSLRDVNAGMPRTVEDLYGFKEQSLYLIKPFDISAKVQTIDTTAADMTVDISIKPEVRGELDASKLARLLQVLPVITATFARANCLASVSLADKAMLPSLSSILPSASSSASLYNLHSPIQEDEKPLHRVESIVLDLQIPTNLTHGPTSLGDEASSYATPPQSPPRPLTPRIVTPRSPRGGKDPNDPNYPHMVEEDPNLTLPLTLPDIVDTRSLLSDPLLSERLLSEQDVIVEDDPTHVSMEINVRMPEVALDLTYDVAKGRHLVLSVRTLEMKIVFRSKDMQILFDLSELSIQDSLRSEAQRNLARTPRGEKSLIHVSYACMYSPLSPLYTKHATEVMVDFASLELNLDVNTIMHLRPFMEVLLARRAPPPSPVAPPSPLSSPSLIVPLSSNKWSRSMNSISSSLNSISLGMDTTDTLKSPVNAMKGMHIIITVSNITFDLLRTPTSDADGAVLASAFSLQITDMRADIDIMDLLKADVMLRSFDIIDTRAVSTDYVFKKVFCPVVDMDASLANWRAVAVTEREGKEGKEGKGLKKTATLKSVNKDKKEKRVGMKGTATARPPDLLHVTYAQISSNISAIEVIVLNVTSFVSTDTILDLSYVAMANAFAILDLIASPPMLPYEPPYEPIPTLPTPPTQTTQSAEKMAERVSSPVHPLLTPTRTATAIPSTATSGIPSDGGTRSGGRGDERDRRGERMEGRDGRDGREEREEEERVSEPGTRRLHAPQGGRPLPQLPSSDSSLDTQSIRTALSKRRTSVSPALATFNCDQNTSPKKPTPTEISIQPEGISSTMNVIVRVTNPRLILLEDPTTDESRAIVGSCDIEVHYSREFKMFSGISPVTNTQNRELRESLHVSVHHHEVFVLRSMLLWHPQPIVEPMGMEFNLRRSTMNGALVSSSTSIDMDNVNARVSVNDIFLAQSIMTRRSLTEPAPALPAAPVLPVQTPPVGVTATPIPENDVTGPVPSYTISLNMGSLSLVGINDFNGQNVPVLRALLDGTTFYAEGSQQKMQGDGSLIASADFYNPRLSVWEPIMDRWHPSLSLTSWALGSSIEIKSDHTMQLTVSGIMLEKLLETYSLFFGLDGEAEREDVPDVLIINALGPSIEFEISDSATSSKIMSLKGYEAKPVPRLHVGRKGDSRSRDSQPLSSHRHTPTVVDVHFCGEFGEQRLPLFHLPFNINKPRAYNLQPRPLGDKKKWEKEEKRERKEDGREEREGGEERKEEREERKDERKEERRGSARNGSPMPLESNESISSIFSTYSHSVVLEPIVEEVFESSRYDPITGRWRQPFLPGDPFEWTDASGTVRREIQSIQLHSDKWEWLGQWAVDMDAVVGDEVDRDRWEYATTFASFSIASRRRSSHAMDCVRRRRWLRTRVPTAGSVDDRCRPLTIFWDVQVLQSGTRRVDVRSGLQVRNVMPFAVMISLCGSAWAGEKEFGPIEEDQTFNVSLLHATASWIKIRPFGFPYAWSQQVACCHQTHDFSSMRDVHCEGEEEGVREREEISPVCMRVLCCQKSKSLAVTVAPFVMIANRLPCDLQYVCNSSDKKRDEGSLLSGSTCKLANISLSFLPKISFRLGDYKWSTPKTIDPLFLDPVKIEMLGPNNNIVVVLTMMVKSGGATGTVEVCISSKGMLCDRTGGLGVSVWARNARANNSDEMIRNTFRPAGSTAAVVTSIVRPSVSSADKQRRKAAVKAAGMVGRSPRQSLIAPGSNSDAIVAPRLKDSSKKSGPGGPGVGGIGGMGGMGVSGGKGERDPLLEVLLSSDLLETFSEAQSLEDLGSGSLQLRYGVTDVSVAGSMAGSITRSVSGSVVEGNVGGSVGGSGLGGGVGSGVGGVGGGMKLRHTEEDGVSDSDVDSFDSDDFSILETFSEEGDGLGLGSGSTGRRHLPLQVRDFTALSARSYEVMRVDLGDRVYTDRALRWTHLPLQLRKQYCIRTPCDDKMTRSKNLMQFSSSRPSLVLVLMDMRAVKSPPKWLKEDGFRRIGDQAIARVIQFGTLQETFYGIFGRYCGKGETVLLKGNWCKEVHNMYSVFIIPAPSTEELMGTGPFSPHISRPRGTTGKGLENTSGASGVSSDYLGVISTRNSHQDIKRIFEEVTFDKTYRRSYAGMSWIEGGNGLSLFHAEEDVVSIGVKSGSVWSEEFNINMATSPHTGSFEAVDWDTMRAYQLSYSISLMPGVFNTTQLLTITPRYCIVNCLAEAVMIVQRGSREILEIAPYQAEGWHKSRASLGTSVQLRSVSSLWSMGSVDLNEVGRSVVHLPKRGSQAGDAPFVVLIEVKIAEPSEHCSLVVVIWQASIETNTSLSIRNDSDVHVTVKQANIDFEQLGLERGLFEICVAPSQCVPFGWADPDTGSDILVTAGSSMIGAKLRIAKLNFLKAGEQLRLPDNSGRIGSVGEVVLSVLAEGGGRVLRIARSADLGVSTLKNYTESDGGVSSASSGSGGSGKSNESEVAEVVRSFGLSFSLASFGVSLVVEKPIRREFLSLYIDGLEGRVKTKGVIRSFEFMIMDLQVDNYSETVVYPVLLHSTKKEVHKSVDLYLREHEEDDDSAGGDKESGPGSTEIPLLQLTLIEELQPDSATSSSILKYVALRVLPLALEVESATLQLLFSDLIADLKFVDRAQTMASKTPDRWIDEYNMKLMSPGDRNLLVDVYRSQIAAQATKMYVEKLVIHPMKITLTFVQSPYPRKRGRGTLQATAINVLTSLAGVDRMQLRLKSFEVDDVLESRASLVDLIVHKTIQDLQSQLAQIAGSLTVLGSPMGFARKVGSGVKSFFYEPYQGAVLGPQDFVVGLGRGTSHLLANVVSGAMNSTVALVGTASKGISFLSGDAEYARKRALKRQRNRANRGGILDGILEGSESIVSGVTSGMSGLVTKPFEEARKSGVKGFFRGVGLGLIGAAVKPVMGFTDGLTSVASGVSNQVGLASVHFIVRPARAFERSASDASDFVLVPLNLEAAYAQEFVIRRAKLNGYEDIFLSYIPMEQQGEAMILSETYVYWRKPKSLWGRTWANISHCYFSGDSVGIVLYGGEAEAVVIPCASKQCSVRVYSALAHNAHRMGHPSNIIPVDLVTQDRDKASSSAREDLIHRQRNAMALAGEIDDYRFGTANKVAMRKIIGPEADVLRRIEGRVESGYNTWKDLDDSIWRLVWEWDCTHTGLQASRCCATVIINRSNSPLQIARVQIVHGKNVLLLGSAATGYETESRAIMPGGSALVFLWAFSPSPVEIGHIKACISTAAFSATVASTQRESSCEAKGGFTVGFLEKSVSDWWSKYILLVT